METLPLNTMRMQRLLPLLGAATATCLILVAANKYPDGYDWLNQSVSSLFQPLAENGQANPARLFASIGVITFCACTAMVFAQVAKLMPTRVHFKAVQIGGIGSMVYAALVTTPMHDTLIGFALAFFVVAMAALLHALYVQRRLGAFLTGALALSLILLNASMHYGEWFGGFLPMVQKLSLLLWIPWLFVLSFRGQDQSSSSAS